MKEGWEYRKLGEVTSFQNGFAFKSSLFRKDGLPIVRISSIQNEKIIEDDLVSFYPSDYDVNFDNYKIFPDDILIAMSGGTTGKLGINKSNKVFYQNQRVGVIRENAKFLNHLYLFYYLHTKSEESLKIAAGAAQPNLSTAQIKEFVIPLPSLEEQQYIVDYLEAAFAKIDAMKANAAKALNEAHALFQASLKEMLDPQKGWEEKTIEFFAKIIHGKNQKEVLDENGLYPIYGSGGNIMGYANAYLCDAGTTILGRKGTIDNPLFINEKFWNVDTAFGIIAKENCNKKFLYYSIKKIDWAKRNTGTTLPSLTQNVVYNVEMCAPSLSEQQSIVVVLDALKSKVDKLQANYEKISQECDALKQAILKQVFE